MNILPLILIGSIPIIGSILFKKNRSERMADRYQTRLRMEWYRYKYSDVKLRELARKNHEFHKESYRIREDEVRLFEKERTQFKRLLLSKGIPASNNGDLFNRSYLSPDNFSPNDIFYATFSNNTRIFILDVDGWLFAKIEDEKLSDVYDRGYFEYPLEDMFPDEKSKVCQFLKETTDLAQATTELIEAIKKREIMQKERHERWAKMFPQKL